MKITLLVIDTESPYFNEQVELVEEIYPPFPKVFACKRSDGSRATFLARQLELLAVEEA